MIEQTREAPQKKSLQVHASTDGVTIASSSTINDIAMVIVLGVIIVSVYFIKYKWKKGS